MNENCRNCKFGVESDYDEIVVDGMVMRRRYTDGRKGVKCTANNIDFEAVKGEILCTLYSPKNEIIS